VKYSRRVEEIRPDPVEREGCLLEIAQKWSFRKFAQMDRDDVVVVILKDEMVAMAHYFTCCYCSRLL